jgi:hypothetical protein
VKDTKVEKGMLKEASSINKSLFTLGKVAPSHTFPWQPKSTRQYCPWQGVLLQRCEVGQAVKLKMKSAAFLMMVMRPD